MSSLLLQEIFEQPALLAQLIATQTAPIAAMAAELARRDIRYIVIAARGSSDNAARYAQYLFGAHNRLPVSLTTPSLFGLYHTPPRLENALVIGISQSGQSPDIVAVLAEARRQQVPAIAITNDAGSPLATTAEYAIALGVGVERSVAATKTYTTQLTALALLAQQVAGNQAGLDDLQRLPDQVAQALTVEPEVAAIATRLAPANRCIVLGRGFNYATAFEIALKIKELTYIAAEPYSSADFQHGPIAIVEPGFPVILVSVGATMRAELAALRDLLRSRGATMVVLSDEPALRHPQDGWLPLPAAVPEWLTPCVAVVGGQMLAYHLALVRGLNPDQPRALNKVTLTQ